MLTYLPKCSIEGLKISEDLMLKLCTSMLSQARVCQKLRCVSVTSNSGFIFITNIDFNKSINTV